MMEIGNLAVNIYFLGRWWPQGNFIILYVKNTKDREFLKYISKMRWFIQMFSNIFWGTLKFWIAKLNVWVNIKRKSFLGTLIIYFVLFLFMKNSISCATLYAIFNANCFWRKPLREQRM